MKQNILDVKNLSVQIDNELILKDINFSVYEHDVVVILGPNGAGKTTLMRALLGLVPYKGLVTWRTKTIGYLPPQEAINRYNLPSLTIQDFFSFKKLSQSNIIRIIEEMGLTKTILSQQFSSLSTGQFQRMMLAWVLIDRPHVLLLDEPTASIDIGGEETVYTLLHKLWEEKGLTILLITHNINIVWSHATNVLCLNKTLISYGPPEKTLTPELLKKIYGIKVALYEHRHLT
jgi:zinc transport system ATP-binding protein